MTVSTKGVTAGPYQGDGISREFTFDFHLLKGEHLQVWLNASQGGADSAQLLKAGVDYELAWQKPGAGLTEAAWGQSVNCNKGKGGVKLISPLEVGQTLTLIREVPLTQKQWYTEGTPFPAQGHEQGLDKLTHIAQQLEREVDGVLKASDAEEGEFILPTPTQRAGTLLGFNAQGQPHAVEVGDGLLYEDGGGAPKQGRLRVKDHTAIRSDQEGSSVVYGDGLTSSRKVVHAHIGAGLAFDKKAQMQMAPDLLEEVRATIDGTTDLQGAIANLGLRIKVVESGGVIVPD